MLKFVCFTSRSEESDDLNVPYSLTGTWEEYPRFNPSVSNVSDTDLDVYLSDDNGSTGGRPPLQRMDYFSKFK